MRIKTTNLIILLIIFSTACVQGKDFFSIKREIFSAADSVLLKHPKGSVRLTDAQWTELQTFLLKNCKQHNFMRIADNSSEASLYDLELSVATGDKNLKAFALVGITDSIFESKEKASQCLSWIKALINKSKSP